MQRSVCAGGVDYEWSFIESTRQKSVHPAVDAKACDPASELGQRGVTPRKSYDSQPCRVNDQAASLPLRGNYQGRIHARHFASDPLRLDAVSEPQLEEDPPPRVIDCTFAGPTILPEQRHNYYPVVLSCGRYGITASPRSRQRKDALSTLPKIKLTDKGRSYS